MFRFDHSMETSGNHWFSYQCRIQKLFWEAGFLTSVARRKTVLQLGGLGGGGCCKPPPVRSRGQGPGKFWLFSILWCSKSKQNTICQGFEIIADLDNYVKEPFEKCILCFVLINVHLELQNDPVISCLHARKNYCPRGGDPPSLTINTHCLCYKMGSKTKDKTNLFIVTNGLQTACILEWMI